MASVLVGGLLAVIVGFAVRSMIKAKKAGKSLSCGCDCGHCAGGCGQCSGSSHKH